MKRYKVFDVVELRSGNKATILDINNDVYKVQITDENGQSNDIREIKCNDINRVIYTK